MNKDGRAYVIQSSIVIFLSILIGYTVFQMRHLVVGPVIKIESPLNWSGLSSTSLIDIKGTAKNTSQITLNDRVIFTNESGEFKERLLLPYGYTIMTIKAKDRFGRTTQKLLHLVYN